MTRLGRTLSPVGYGAFKIGRNEGIKYPEGYDLPDIDSTRAILNGVLDMGITLIDTAPAYGLSEERLGSCVADRASEFLLSTKVGETFAGGQSTYDYSRDAVVASVHRSLGRLKRDVLDLVFVHSDGRDMEILDETDVVPTLRDLQAQGLIRHLGFSGKTTVGSMAALMWCDAVMVEYHLEDESMAPVIDAASSQDIAVFVKKGLRSGHLSPEESIAFVLSNPGVTSLVIGGLNLEHMRSNVGIAQRTRPADPMR